MTALIWDDVGDRMYQSGVDHGVLGIADGVPIPWNGLIGVDETPTAEVKSYYIDGVKFMDSVSPGDFTAKLRAYTYPDEFEQFIGVAEPGSGFGFHDQPYRRFNLSYRTKISNDVDANLGYKITFLYNLTADPEPRGFNTLTDSSVQPVEFSWSLTGVPVKIQRYRPTVQVTLNSLTVDPEIFAEVEALLYGTDESDARFPDMDELAGFFGYIGNLVIVDNGDGTWSAIGQVGPYISMIDETTFQIDNVDAVYLDADTYEVSTTHGGWE